MPSLSLILENCTCNLANYTMMTKDIPLDITLTADDGYIFKTAPTVSSASTGSLDITTEDNKVYTGTITALSSYSVTLTATAESESEPIYFSVDVTNATTNILAETPYNDGDIVRVEVVADDGYYFSTAPTLSYYVLGVGKQITMLSDDTEEHKTNFYYDIEIISQMSRLYGIVVSGDGQVIPDNDKYGIITMYNPTPTELKQIGQVRYKDEIDLGNYIANVIKIFVKIPQGKTAQVLLGGYNTGVESNVITNDIIETDCDTVEIVGKYGNAMDYENTTVEMYLPFIGFVELDTVKVMNETLKLIYKTNVINGDSIACIYNTTGTLLYTFNCNASFEIPYRLNAEIESKGKLNVDSNYLFGFTPFVTIRYNKAYNSASMGSEDDRYTTLENESGFVKCSEVFNTINATKEEREEIDTLLKEGVLL